MVQITITVNDNAIAPIVCLADRAYDLINAFSDVLSRDDSTWPVDSRVTIAIVDFFEPLPEVSTNGR